MDGAYAFPPIHEASASSLPSSQTQTHRKMPSATLRAEEMLLQDQERSLSPDDHEDGDAYVEIEDPDHEERVRIWPVLAAGCTLWGYVECLGSSMYS